MLDVGEKLFQFLPYPERVRIEKQEKNLLQEKMQKADKKLKHTAAVGCNQTKKRITLFVDARAIMHLYGIEVPLNRELNSPVKHSCERMIL